MATRKRQYKHQEGLHYCVLDQPGASLSVEFIKYYIHIGTLSLKKPTMQHQLRQPAATTAFTSQAVFLLHVLKFADPKKLAGLLFPFIGTAGGLLNRRLTGLARLRACWYLSERTKTNLCLTALPLTGTSGRHPSWHPLFFNLKDQQQIPIRNQLAWPPPSTPVKQKQKPVNSPAPYQLHGPCKGQQLSLKRCRGPIHCAFSVRRLTDFL